MRRCLKEAIERSEYAVLGSNCQQTSWRARWLPVEVRCSPFFGKNFQIYGYQWREERGRHLQHNRCVRVLHVGCDSKAKSNNIVIWKKAWIWSEWFSWRSWKTQNNHVLRCVYKAVTVHLTAYCLKAIDEFIVTQESKWTSVFLCISTSSSSQMDLHKIAIDWFLSECWW